MFDRIVRVRGVATPMVLAATLLVVGCSSEPEEQPPHAAFLTSMQALKDNDLQSFIVSAMGTKQYRELAEKWDEARRQTVSDADRAQFNLMLGMVTAPGAEDNLMALIEPQLAQWRPQVKEMIFGLQAFATLQLQNASELDAEQREMLTQGVQSLTEWVKNNDLTSAESARRAIAIGTKTVRDLGVQSIDDVNALDYDALLKKASAILAGVKQMLAVYGVGIDEMIDSVEAETVDQQDDRATVRVRFDFFGTRQQAQAEFVRVDGQWLSEDAVKGAQDAMSGELAAMSPLDAADDASPASPVAPSPGDQPETPAAEVVNQAAPEPPAAETELPPPSQEQAAPPVIDQTPKVEGEPDEVYLAYRDALASADSFTDIENFWAPWVSATAANQGADVKQRKLEQLREFAADAEVLATDKQAASARLTVSGTRNDGQSIQGTVDLVRSGDEWRIDWIAWSQPATPAAEAVAAAPVPEAPSVTQPDMQPADPTPGADSGSAPAETGAAPAPADAPPAAKTTSTAAMDKDALQASFDSNPFLNHYGMKFRVLQLSQGFATVELAEGPSGLVDRLNQGVDLTVLDPQNLADGRERQALNALRKLSDTLVSNGNVVALLIVAPTPSVEASVAAEDQPASPEPVAERTNDQQMAATPSAEQLAKEQARQKRRAMVRAIQSKLAALGYEPGPADGVAGSGTRAAISEYQRAADLPEDGRPSETLRAHLYSDRAVTKPEPQPIVEPEPEVVEAEQEPEKPKLTDRIGGFFKKILKPNAEGDDTPIPEPDSAE